MGRAFLDVAIKAADNLDRTFDQSKPLDYADHPQVEIGLFKLYEATGEMTVWIPEKHTAKIHK